MSAQISSLFTIDIVETIAAGTAKTVTNPGRSFRIVQVLVTGLNNAVCVVKKNDNAGVQASSTTLVTGDLNAFPSAITAANATFAATDNVYVSVATADVSRVSLICESADGQALTVA